MAKFNYLWPTKLHFHYFQTNHKTSIINNIPLRRSCISKWSIVSNNNKLLFINMQEISHIQETLILSTSADSSTVKKNTKKSGVRCQISYVLCQVSGVMCQVTQVMCCVSPANSPLYLHSRMLLLSLPHQLWFINQKKNCFPPSDYFYL